MKRPISRLVALIAFGLILSACNDSGMDTEEPTPGPTPAPAISAGAEGGVCKEDGTCDAGLSCSAATKICLKTIVIQTCEGEGVCPEGYECKENKCVSTGPKAGEEGGACLTDNKCNGELKCIKGSCKKNPCPAGMAFIPGGTFKMGSTTGDSDEKPVHDVTVSDFCMDEKEFTNANRDAINSSIVADEVYTAIALQKSPAGFDSPNQPFVNVSWTEAKVVCEKQKKRLPTEAEWEYAARGGTQAEYGTKDGAVPDKDNACWSGGAGNTAKSATCSVGSYPKNAYELYDMSGNVWEWVNADYKSYPSSSWISNCSTCKVLRGGSWNITGPTGLRAALRNYNGPGLRYYGLGFRCVGASQDSKE